MTQINYNYLGYVSNVAAEDVCRKKYTFKKIAEKNLKYKKFKKYILKTKCCPKHIKLKF